MTFKLLLEISGLFIGLFLLGSGACLPAYRWSFTKFFASKLWIKILWWLPIFAVFVAVLYGGELAAVIVVALLSAQALRELGRQPYRRDTYIGAYPALVIACLFHLPAYFKVFPTHTAVAVLIAVCFASVLSDVVAFFLGTYAGRHALPAFINAGKTYEGVAGQLIGAFVGMGLVALLPEISFSWQLALTVGMASAAGDILNSITKRMLNIKDWGNTIPGHGGVLDRFASLSLALAAGFWLSLLIV